MESLVSIRAFVAMRNELYTTLSALITGYLQDTADTYVLAQITNNKGWISNVVDEAVIEPPEPYYFERQDMCSVIITCERAIPYIFFIDKKLTKVYCYV